MTREADETTRNKKPLFDQSCPYSESLDSTIRPFLFERGWLCALQTLNWYFCA